MTALSDCAGGDRVNRAEGDFALLLAAHGERRSGARNRGVAAIAERLAEWGVAAEVGFGFLKGAPSIGEAVRRFARPELLVYPLFLADGYFTQTLLPRQLQRAGAFEPGRVTELLPSLACDPALAELVLDRASVSANAHGWPAAAADLILFAHGSTNNAASREATERVAGAIAAKRAFARVRTAFLEEPPFLAQAVGATRAPVVVVGLFAGEGLHGGDAPQLVKALGRSSVAFAGNVGGFEALPAAIAAAIRRRRPRVSGPSPVCRS